MSTLRVWLLPLLLILAAGPPVLAQGRLQVSDVELGGETIQFAAHAWRGHPAVTALTRQAVQGAPPRMALHVVVLDAKGWHEAGHWALPPQTRYVEPLTLAGGTDAWLVLMGPQWQLATVHGAKLERHDLCVCDTIYSHGGAPDPRHARFVYDLDGDGADEVLLPYIGYLEAYRLIPGIPALEPLWRIYWHPDKTPLPREKNPQNGFILPHFTVVPIGPKGPLSLIVAERDRALVTPLPPLKATKGFAMDDTRRTLLARQAGADMPPGLAEALRRLGDRHYGSASVFLHTLAQHSRPADLGTWSALMPDVLTLARSEVPVRLPYAVPLAGLGSFTAKDRAVILGTMDMDGDGVPDLLHAKLINTGSVLNQQDELRWYRGHIENGRLALTLSGKALKSDAGSFAEVVHLRTNDQLPLVLLKASTQVSLSAILKALATQTVTLHMSILPWRDGRLASQALSAHTFTYRSLRAKGRRAQFLFADLNGDGWRDAILNLDRGQLSVFLSHNGPPELNQATFVQSNLRLPSRPERVLVADLLGDGHEELVLRFRPDYAPKLATKLRLLRYVPQ